ncbi:phage major capsid protein [Gracilimonas sp.]|uniref:phage major capsid protein n=1 Tax=Gracilimonas sp. TaxID=1974203 RepID=UPI003BAB70E4
MTLTEMKQERDWLLTNNNKAIKKAESEGRDLNDKEVAEFEENLKRMDKLTEAIEIRKEQLIREAESAEGFTPIQQWGNTPQRPRTQKGVEKWESISGPSKGSEVRVLNTNRSFYEDLKSQNPEEFRGFENYNWANYIRDRLGGTTRNMDTSNDSELVPVPLSAQVIDLARNKSRIFQAGAKMVPMTSKTLDIARVTSDVNAEWKAEGATWSASDVGIDKVTLTAKTLVAGTKLSVELSEDAPNANQVIMNSIANKLALELDRVALVGSGSGQEPEGLYLNSNVNEVSMGDNGSVIDDFSEIITAQRKILDNNGEPRSAIYAPRTWEQIEGLTDSNGNPLQWPKSWSELQRLHTNQVPIDQDQGTSTGVSSSIFLGDYSQMLVGMRTNLRLEVSRVATDANDSAWETLQIFIRGYLRADVQFAHPDHFCRVVGLIE